jgi:hypothetical protein
LQIVARRHDWGIDRPALEPQVGEVCLKEQMLRECK